MSLEQVLHVLEHAIIDSLKVLSIVLVFYIILSFIETKISKRLDKNNKYAPVFGALSGLIPQCGVSVVAADLYIKNHITTGTLLAVFIACSDEALPILLSSQDKFYMVIPLILSKVIIAIIIGYLFDLMNRKNIHSVTEHKEHCHHAETIHVGCCNHEIDNEKESKISKHLLHPLLHSLKLFIYVLIINLLFGFIVELIGEEAIANFLQSNRYLSPLFAILIGLIPNCSSSIIISELYLLGGIGFGACLAGLCVNAGLGSLFILKNCKERKKALTIIISMIIISLIVGYLTSLILQFK